MAETRKMEEASCLRIILSRNPVCKHLFHAFPVHVAHMAPHLFPLRIEKDHSGDELDAMPSGQSFVFVDIKVEDVEPISVGVLYNLEDRP